MSFSAYIWGICLFTLLSFAAWLGIVISVDPYSAGLPGMILFFASFFAFLLGILTLLVTQAYRYALGEVSTIFHIGSAFRQALLLALFGVGILFFQYVRILTWWDALLLLAFVLLLEFSFRTIQRRRIKKESRIS